MCCKFESIKFLTLSVYLFSKNDNGYPMDAGVTNHPLRVEFLFKTEIGYPKDTEVTLFNLATPRNPLGVCFLVLSRDAGARMHNSQCNDSHLFTNDLSVTVA